MAQKSITIGRSDACNIALGDACKSASRLHAVIHVEGDKYELEDCSSNGTMLNGVMINHRIVPIKRGDVILVAGKYLVDWEKIERHLNMVTADMQEDPLPLFTEHGPEKVTWSWGAFAIYPIWGLFNGCKWAVAVFFLLGWSVLPSFIFAMFGKRYAWENAKWNSYAEFLNVQKEWDKYGLWSLLADIVVIIALALIFI